MSTCPDSDLYSAYVDGEVPSPWKEKLEAHMASCPACQTRAGKFEKLHRIIHDGTRVLSDEELELSFNRLSQRRTAMALSSHSRRPLAFPAWARESVRIPLPALAAVILAAVFLPTYFTLKAGLREGSVSGQFANALPELSANDTNISQKMQAMATSTPIYSPDLPAYSTPASLLTTNGQRIFTMVNIARQFATEKDLFSNAEIIIIKLPDLTQFSNTGERLFPEIEPLQQAVGFYK